jgi:hypothetical protein
MTTDTGFGFGNNFNINTIGFDDRRPRDGTTFKAIFEVPFRSRRSRSARRHLRRYHDRQRTAQRDAQPEHVRRDVGVDGTLAMYKSAGADVATLSAVTWQVYQSYLEQGPRQSDGTPILPFLDIGTAYILTSSSSPGAPVVNIDNTAPVC